MINGFTRRREEENITVIELAIKEENRSNL